MKHKIAVSVKFSRHVCFEILRVANKLYSALFKYCDFTKDFSFEPFKLSIFGKTKFFVTRRCLIICAWIKWYNHLKVTINGESETNRNTGRSRSEQYLKTTCYLALCLHVVNGCLEWFVFNQLITIFIYRLEILEDSEENWDRLETSVTSMLTNVLI